MDDQKKQKILIGVLAVAALGAGGYWFMQPSADTGEQVTPGVVRSQRRKVDKPVVEKTESRRRSAPTAERAERATRRERPQAEQKTASRRNKARGRAKKVKKEMTYPAS